MSLAHALSGQPVAVAPFGPGLAGQRTVALFKSAQLEVIRLVLAAGELMFLQGEVPHSVTAREAASALVTIVLGK